MPSKRPQRPRDIPSSRRCSRRRAQRGRMERDDRGDRGEAHLEAGPASASGRNRSTTNAPAAISRMLIASRPSAIPPRTSRAATQLRTVGTCVAGQQGVADACQPPRAGGDQHQVEAQRQPLAEREQLQRQEHGESDHRGDVQSADREQVGQTAAAHRVGIVLVDGILVAGRRWRWRCPRVPGSRADMLREAGAHPSRPLRRRQPDNDRPERLADCANPLEPGVAREIIGARQRHRRRRRSRARSR